MNFNMNSDADSAHFFYLASPPRSPVGSLTPSIAQYTTSPTGVNNSPAYYATIIPTLGIKALSAFSALFAVLVLILSEIEHDSFTVAEIILILQSFWNILMIAKHYLQVSQERHGNEATEKKIRSVEIGLIVGLVLSLSVGYFISEEMRWYYSGWNPFWGCSLGWIVM